MTSKIKNSIITPTMKNLWKLGAPTIVEQFLATAVSYVDTAMVGHINTQASAAVGLTATVIWLQNGIFFVMSVGCISFIARSVGAGDDDSAHKTSVQGLWMLLALAAFETIVFLSISGSLPGWLNASQEIRHDASVYFFIISCPLLFRGSIIIFGNILRANKDSRTPMVVNICVNVLNIILNQLLIGSDTSFALGCLSVHVPGARLGVAGSAIATAVSQSIGGIVIFMAVMHNPATTLRGQDMHWNWKIARPCIIVALPLSAERLAVGMGYVAFSGLVASLGTLSTSAHSIALTIEQAFYVPGYGLQTAVTTIAGNAVGKRKETELREVVRSGLYITVSIMTVMSVFLFIFATPFIGLFTRDREVIKLGALVLRIVSVSEPLFAILITFEGIFHGIGETKIPFYFAVFTMWGIRNFGTFICIHVFHFGLPMVWVCMVADNVCRCCLLTMWYVLKKWKKRLNLQ